MCQHQVTLAKRGRARYVTQCEHGTVHVVWDGVGFHLPARAFVRMANNILQTRSVVQALKLSSTKEVSLPIHLN